MNSKVSNKTKSRLFSNIDFLSAIENIGRQIRKSKQADVNTNLLNQDKKPLISAFDVLLLNLSNDF